DLLCKRITTHVICLLSLHDALPIYPFRRALSHPRDGTPARSRVSLVRAESPQLRLRRPLYRTAGAARNPLSFHVHPIATTSDKRSEEHTSELQSRENIVCRLLLETK